MFETGQILEPFHRALRRSMPVLYPFDTALTNGPNVTFGSIVALLAPLLDLSTGAPAGPNRIREQGDNYSVFGISPHTDSGVDMWGRPWYVRVFALPVQATNPSASQHYGIEVGSLGVPPYGAISPSPCVQLRSRMDTRGWELVVARGGGVATVVTPLTGVRLSDTAGTGNYWSDLELFYKPGEYVRAYIDGVLGAEHTNPATMPAIGSVEQFGPTLFVTSGSAAASLMDCVYWHMEYQTFGRG